MAGGYRSHILVITQILSLSDSLSYFHETIAEALHSLSPLSPSSALTELPVRTDEGPNSFVRTTHKHAHTDTALAGPVHIHTVD